MEEGNFGIDENDTSLGELIVYLTNKKCTKIMESISATHFSRENSFTIL